MLYCIRLISGILIIFAFSILCTPGTDGQNVSSGEDRGWGRYIDTHVHFDSKRTPWNKQRQGGKGNIITPGTNEDFLPAATFLIGQMDKYGIKKAMIMPPPAKSAEQGNKISYKSILPAIKKHRGRLLLVAGGDILNPMIHSVEEKNVNPAIKKIFREKAYEIINNGAVGFGETAVLHLSMQDRHGFEQVSADHPLYLLLSDISAEKNIPIDIHMEVVPEDMETPSNLRRASKNNPEKLKATIPGFERLLEHNRKAKIVWQHIGWDNTGYMTAELMERLLGKHPNPYLSLRVEERTNQVGEGGPMPNRIVDEDMKIKPRWRDLIMKFPERFMIGSDEFMGTEKNSRSPQSFEETWPILNQLPPEIARKIGYENPARVYNLTD